MLTRASFHLGALILGAGRSVRMGRPKLLLPWGETSILGHLLVEWREAGANQVLVVHAEQDSAMLAELDRLGVTHADRVSNPNPEEGMMSSITCGARSPNWQPALTHFAIVLGDQPHLRQSTLMQLISFASQHSDQVCQPSFNTRHRHPVVLPRDLFVKLRQSPVATLKEFLSAQPSASFESDDPGLELDIDRPDDYARALALAAARG